MSQHTPLNRILINGTQREEIRIALTADKYLEDLFIQSIDQQPTAGNIYLAKVSRIVPSLQAAFVDYGAVRHGFLPLKEIAPHYYKDPALYQTQEYINISDVLNEGQVILVQVEKEERGSKGAALTSFISLAGSYLVLMPNNADAGGVSRRVEGEERDQLRDLLSTLQYPPEMGLIVRTAGVGKAVEELQWDLDILVKLWSVIDEAEKQQTPPCLIHQESDIIIRALRDYLRKDIHEIIIDTPHLYEQARKHLATVHPELDIVKFYSDPAIPLFTRYHIENQIESAFQRDVRLPSGGYIVIQETEALVSIDVNSARDTKSGDIELTAFNTNREAAIEVARQLRLRDLGGLIVIDFIDMNSPDHQQQVVDTFKNEIRHDKARVQYSRISRFGLLEISRQRLRPSLKEASQIVCPRCSGQGSIRSVESLALLILRLLRQEAMQPQVTEVHAQVPVEVATFLMNEKRAILTEIEHHQRVLVRILPNPYMETPEYKIERIYESQTSQQGKASFEHLTQPDYVPPVVREESTSKVREPIVKEIDTPIKPIIKQTLKKPGRLTKVLKGFFGKILGQEEPAAKSKRHGHTHRNRKPSHNRTRSAHPQVPHAGQAATAQPAQRSQGGQGGQRRHRSQQQTNPSTPRHARTTEETSSRSTDTKRAPRRDTRTHEGRAPRQARQQETTTAAVIALPAMPVESPREPVHTAPVMRTETRATQNVERNLAAAGTIPPAQTKPAITALEVKPGLYTSAPSQVDTSKPVIEPSDEPVTLDIAANQDDATDRSQRQQQRRPHHRNRYRRHHRAGQQQRSETDATTEIPKITEHDE